MVAAWSLGGFAWWPRQKTWQALERRDYLAAKVWVQRAAQLEPHSAKTEWLFARVKRKLGSPDEAMRHLRTARQLGAESELVRREELLLQAQSGDLDNILRDLDKLLIDHSEDGAEICEAYPNGLLINGQVDAATAIIQQWQQAFPNDPQTDYLFGRLAEFKRRTKEAERHFRAALAKAPSNTPSLFALGRTQIQANLWNEALATYQQSTNSAHIGPAQLESSIVNYARCARNFG
ncbi:MAG: hypothetical protein NT013_05715, partial [Planctomycetia bacterium]|nr:hypothetical protein [Planctomycetia bacterium]